MRRWLAAVLALSFLVPGVAAKRRKPSGKTKSFDYYLLSLSWAPDFCASHPDDKSTECKSGNHTAFVLHGLWPQANSGAPPESCGGSPVPAATSRKMLEYFPTRSLIAHEWQKHGTCSGLSASDYFDKVEEAYTSVKIPDPYTNLGSDRKFPIRQIEQDFAKANDAPAGAFRVSCHAGELASVEVCLSKDLQYQACSQTARECTSAQVMMRGTK